MQQLTEQEIEQVLEDRNNLIAKVHSLEFRLQKEKTSKLEELTVARETNRRLNRRVQKLEQRINRWESRRYTINRWRQWLISWYRAEKARADRLEKELQKYRTPSIWNIWYKK